MPNTVSEPLVDEASINEDNEVLELTKACEEVEVDEVSDLKELTVKELKAMCKDLGIRGYSKLNEDELIEKIEEARV